VKGDTSKHWNREKEISHVIGFAYNSFVPQGVGILKYVAEKQLLYQKSADLKCKRWRINEGFDENVAVVQYLRMGTLRISQIFVGCQYILSL
jgi:hypothetical protein